MNLFKKRKKRLSKEEKRCRRKVPFKKSNKEASYHA